MLYPILTESRSCIDLSGTWEFKRDKDGVGFEEQWYKGRLTHAQTMPVPAAYNDLKEDAGLREHYGWVFYQRTVIVPEFLKSQRVMLRMEAVAHKARVYWNGTLLCQHKGGFLPFEAELNHVLAPGEGYLYQVEITGSQDHYCLPYGIRTVKVEGSRFLINGKPFYFKGYGKHEDTFPNGRGFHPVMNAKDISLMKWQGANSFRTSHYPYSEEMMRLCDREGIVVIDETPAVGVGLKFGGGISPYCREAVTFKPFEEGGIGTYEHHREVIRNLIDRDKNHACVVMWSLANEPDSDSPGSYEYFAPLFELARSLDPQKRPCTIVCMKGDFWKEDVTIALSDVICLNRYYGWYDFGGELSQAEEALREEMEWWDALGKPVMMTEYGADTVAGLRDTLPVMFTEEYQTAYYEMNHRVFDSLKNFVGEQVWNFADFATCQGTGRVQGNKKGIFTRDRKPKMAAHYLRNRWNSMPDFGRWNDL